jgi:hypothetical protein
MTSRVVAVLGLLLLAGCAAEPARITFSTVTAPPETTTTTRFPPLPSGAVIPTTKRACEEGIRYNPVDAPYRGAGPHLAEVTELEQSVDGLQHDPASLHGSGVPTPADIHEVQLLVCVKPLIGARAGDVTCKFSKGVAASITWPFYEATYEITVREAVSGRVITTSSLPGDDTPEGSCPSFATDSPGTLVARSLTEPSLGEVLRPLINATV